MKINYKKWGLIFGIALILVLSLNSILGNIISKVVQAELDKINKKGELFIVVDDVNFDVITSNLTLKDITIKPDSLVFENFKLGKAYKATFSEIALSKLKIKGFSIFRILLFDEVAIRKILVDEMDIIIYKSDKYDKSHPKNKSKKSISLDSIFIKGIDQIDLSNIEFIDLDIKIIDIQNNELLFSYNLDECEISGVELEANSSNYFRFDKDALKINLIKQNFELLDGNYALLFDEINYNYKESTLNISNLKFNPTIDKFKLSSTYKYNKEVFNAETKSIRFHGLYLDSIINTGVVVIDSIVVDEMILGVFKNQTKPFDLNKHPKFINQTLKNLKQPLNIGKVIVRNSELNYSEKYENRNELMAVDITNLSAEMNFITSIKDSLKSDKKLTINLKGDLCKVAPMNLDIFMPYNTWNNSFSFVGSVGQANFSAFNSAIFPATGVKLSAGTLNSIQFTVSGTPQETTGKMSLLYSGLEAKMIKKGKVKKGLNWLANAVFIASNPSEKGKQRTALIKFERVSYKGFGNLLWKSIMSGMVNTMVPFGKLVKEPKPNKKNNSTKKPLFGRKKN